MGGIFRAVQEGDEAEVNSLLDADLTLLERVGPEGFWTSYDKYKIRPLAVAARYGQLGMVRLLVQRGANVNARDHKGTTALIFAVYGDHEEVVGFLLRQGARTDGSTGRHSAAPLIAASKRGNIGVLRQLLQHMQHHGLDDADEGGETALHWAALGGHEEVVRLLLLAGADPTSMDDLGRTPRATAEEGGRTACARLLEWWEGKLKRRYILCKATCLHKAYTTQRNQPTSQVPTYLLARVAAGHAVPGVEVVSPQSQEEEGQTGASGKRKAAGETGDEQGAEAEGDEEERHAMVEYVVKGLNEELLTELLQGFHGQM